MSDTEIIEAAERLFTPSYTNYKVRRQGFAKGAKWAADRLYTEEEVKSIIDKTLIEYSDYVLADIPEWFNQFKKK